MTEFVDCRPHLEVTDLGPTVAFLRDVLGFAVVRTADPAVNETTTCYITVTEVDTLHDICERQGARVTSALADHPWGLRDFVVEVPGGHRLAIGERLA
ncbi:MAG: hypothetical protein ACRDXE_10900 [Acidimicrobiales bacterium]